MNRRLLSLALALAVLCQAAVSLAFAPFESINATVPSLKGLGTNFDPIAPGQKTPGGITPVANLAANTEACVKTVRDCFRWEPTSTATSDDITVVSLTANGANPGRFLRLFRGDPYWRAQTAWKVDTAGNDENDGSTLAPVKTDAEIQRRWAGPGNRARIATVVTITYAQSPTAQTNLLFETVTGGQVRIVGTPTVTKVGTVLTAVQTQVRTAGSELGWAITAVGLDATDVGKIAVITASGTPANVGAAAMIVKDETGGKLRVAPFGTLNETNTAYTNITPQVGDTIEIRDMAATTLQVGRIEAHAVMNASLPSTVVFDSILLDGGSAGSGGGSVYAGGAQILYTRTVLKTLSLTGFSSPAATPHIVRGGGVLGVGTVGITIRGVLASLSSAGCLFGVTVAFGGNAFVGQDTYFQNARLSVSLGGIVQSSGSAFFDRTTASTALTVQEGGRCVQTGAVPDWGANNAGYGVVVQSGASYGYVTKPTINSGLGVGREAKVGGTDKLYSAIPYVEAANNAALVLTQ